MSGVARSFRTFKGFCPSWNWVFAEAIAPGAELEGPAIHIDPGLGGGGGGGGGFAPMAPLVGDPPPENSVYEPGRWTVTALIRTTTGNCYIYYTFQMTDSTRHRYKIFVKDVTAIRSGGAYPIHLISQVDFWYIVIANRSDVNSAFVEGAVSVWARGFA